MIIHRQEYFKCVIPERNKSAFYLMIAGRDLFGYILIRRWGRIGTKGQPRLQMRFTTEEDLFEEYNRVRKERLKREYRVVSRVVTPGKVIGLSAGDTITVLQNHQQYEVRLSRTVRVDHRLLPSSAGPL